MRLRSFGPWPETTADARALQGWLTPQVSQRDGLSGQPRLVAGLDISSQDDEGRTLGAVVLLRWHDMAVVEVRTAAVVPAMPYVPGLLAFRELPVLLKALEKLRETPDLVLVDGHGLAHPPRFGLASHIGLVTGLPTVGCAKSVLVGRHGSLGNERGAWFELVHNGEVVGAAVRTRHGVTPLYVSVRHRVELATALRLVLACSRRYRLPEGFSPSLARPLAGSGTSVQREKEATDV